MDRSYSSFCDVNATVSCTQAYLSPYGSFLGVPVALAGVFFFALVLRIAALSGRKTPQAGESAPAYIFALSTVGARVRALSRLRVVLRPARGLHPLRRRPTWR